MHPKRAALIAFSDHEGDPVVGRRIASHLSRCTMCRDEVERIRTEKDELSPRAGLSPGMEPGLRSLLASIAAWQAGRSGGTAADLKSRVRSQIEVYLGVPSVSVVERPGMRAEELLAKAGQVLDVFLGPAAAQAVRDEVLCGLDCTGALEAYE